MKLLVLAGSPKGPLSGTLQYVRFLQKQFPEHELEIVDICQEHEQIERDGPEFGAIIEKVRAADAVLWAYPVYNFLVHAYYKRFIELIFARAVQDAFRDKYTATLTTSIHFFDHTSHNYMQAICDDLGMRYVGSFSAGVFDLLKKDEKKRLVSFAKGFFAAVANRLPTARAYDPVRHDSLDYTPAAAGPRRDLAGKRMLILTDSDDDGSNCARMVRRFCACFGEAPEVVNLHAIAIRAACNGCFECGADGVCVFRDADDVHGVYVSKIAAADAIVIAGSVRDRYLSSRWKIFLDRGFFRPVIPWFPGKQVAILLSGPLRQLPNLRQILEGYVEFHQGHLAGIVTDEYEDSAELDRAVDGLAERVAFCLGEGYARPRTFLGIGGTKIFRDDTWGFLRPVFQVAYQYYRRHGLYDFPQSDIKTRMMAIGGMLVTKLPGVRKRFFKSLKEQISRCLAREVDK